ncbi:MAG TPA: signal peptidase II [Ignavibacteriaceae bacterium]|nr:signal peptidase II [Ignavibacteriaceae bacterium]
MRILYLTLAIILADQISKFYIKGISIPALNIKFDGMYLGESIPVIGDFFKITFIENPGMAFGFDPGSDFKLFISVFSLVASIGLLVYLYTIRKKSLSIKIAIALILGGAVGNVIDRMFYGLIFDYAPLFYGKVVDFFDFDFFNFSIFGRSYDRWPIFNIADAAVSIGVLILLFFYKHHEAEDKKSREAAEELDKQSNAEKLISENEPSSKNINGELSDGEADKGKEISV